jgi:hypothetical protein
MYEGSDDAERAERAERARERGEGIRARMERHSELSDDEATISAEERPGSPPDLPELGLAAMGFALIVYAHHFDWPDPDVIANIVRGLAPSDAA